MEKSKLYSGVTTVTNAGQMIIVKSAKSKEITQVHLCKACKRKFGESNAFFDLKASPDGASSVFG